MSKATELVQQYFDLSNEHKLAEIEKLFGPSSTYSSVHTGLFLGADEIMAMQKEFHAGFKELRWEVERMEEVKPSIVLVDFNLVGISNTGEKVTRSGLEYVVVFSDKIQHIEIQKR